MRGPVASWRYRAIAIVAATVLTALSALAASPTRALAATQIQVYGTWLCGTDECTWASVPNMTTFDQDNHWLIDRGDGTPSVNLVVLAFVNPLKLLDQTTDSGDVNGVPAGMTSTVVDCGAPPSGPPPERPSGGAAPAWGRRHRPERPTPSRRVSSVSTTNPDQTEPRRSSCPT